MAHFLSSVLLKKEVDAESLHAFHQVEQPYRLTHWITP